jgi:hypothetical protein
MAFTRRHLPHWIPGGTDIFVTRRLAGSLPSQADMKGSGPAWLQNPQVADIVMNALLHGESPRDPYQLHTRVIMPKSRPCHLASAGRHARDHAMA